MFRNCRDDEGERKCEHEATEEGVYTCERSYGHFRREIPLPEGVKTDTAKANFKNGILEITFDAPETDLNRVVNAFSGDHNCKDPRW